MEVESGAPGQWAELTLAWSDTTRGLIALATTEGAESLYLNHEVARIQAILEATGDRAVILRTPSVLAIPHDFGSHFLFSVRPSEGEPLDPCRFTNDVPWVADLQGGFAVGECQSTAGFDNHVCTGSAQWYAQIDALGYGLTHPRWEGKLCDSCREGWQEWETEEPRNIRVVSISPIIAG